MRQLAAIELQTMGAGQSPRHERGAVGLANRRGHMEVGETTAARSQRVDVRRAQDRVSRAAQVVGPVLIGDEQQEIGPVCLPHQSALMFNSLANWL